MSRDGVCGNLQHSAMTMRCCSVPYARESESESRDGRGKMGPSKATAAVVDVGTLVPSSDQAGLGYHPSVCTVCYVSMLGGVVVLHAKEAGDGGCCVRHSAVVIRQRRDIGGSTEYS
jgi:hypothetical protein